MTYAIIKGAPIPPIGYHRLTLPPLPFAELEDLDAFDVPLPKDDEKECLRIRSLVGGRIKQYVKHNPDRKFISRIMREKGVLRVWRVA